MSSEYYLECASKFRLVDLKPGSNIVGRSPSTKIKDIRCSRKQVEIDVHGDVVWLMVLGAAKCVVAGRHLRRGCGVQLRDGDFIEFLNGQICYQLLRRAVLSSDAGVEVKSVCQASNPDSAPDAIDSMAPGPLKQLSLDRFRPATATAGSTVATPPARSDRADLSAIKSENRTSGIDGATCPLSLVDNGNMYMMQIGAIEYRPKIAAFDLDGTLIRTKSGRVFPVNVNDWQLLLSVTASKLRELHEQNYRIVIFTNQLGVSRGKLSASQLAAKLGAVTARLGVPVQCFVAHQDNGHRKPRIGMWKYLVEQCNAAVGVKMTDSFYCGDAAGRNAGWAPGKKKDFSCADRLFALNVGLPFHTPEELFLGERVCTKYTLPEFDPREAVRSGDLQPDLQPDQLTRPHTEVAVLVGAPGSGKSHLAATVFSSAGYVIANRDTLRSWQKCVQLAEQTLKCGGRVVVDNTSGSVESRARYLQLAAQFGVPCRCLLMTTTVAHCRHNNKFRELTGSVHQRVSDVVINTYMSTFVPPTKEEGFSEIISIDWRASFANDEQSQLYQLYLIEK